MRKGTYEGIIAIPQKDGRRIIAQYWVKAYDEGSEYGIDGGRISKLSIKINNEWVVNYERGWDIKPDKENEAAQIALAIIIKDYN